MRALRALGLAALAVVLIADPALAGSGTVTAKVEPDNVVPKGPKGASGVVTLDINTNTNDICYDVQLSGLAAKATHVHVHDTFQGTDDPVVLTFLLDKGPKGCVNDLDSTFLLSNAPRHDVDVHVEGSPNAALRGKLGYTCDPGKPSPEAEARIQEQKKLTPNQAEKDFTPKEASGALVAEGYAGAPEQNPAVAAAQAERNQIASVAAIAAADAAALARTGSSTALLGMVGVSLVGLGGMTTIVARRRRQSKGSLPI